MKNNVYFALEVGGGGHGTPQPLSTTLQVAYALNSLCKSNAARGVLAFAPARPQHTHSANVCSNLLR